ncbi:MAG: hypothetical protein ACR2QV_05730 [Gammaproteobacteria bacterium]
MNRIANIIQVLVVLAAAVWPGVSGAYMEVLARSYELSLDEVTLPAHEASQVVVKPCGECDSVVHPVNGQTTYHVGVNTASVSLGELLAAVNEGVGSMVLVAVNPNTGEVVRITLDTGV